MSFEWKKYTIADVSKKVITGKTPPGTLDKYFGGEVLFVTPTDMGDNKYIELTQRTLSDEGEAKLAKQKFECGIVVSCIGWQMGKAAIVRNTAVTNQQINTIIPNGDLIDVDFLYYTLSEKRTDIFNLGATATRTPILKKSLFEKIEFHAPKLEQQKKIGNVLSSLDAKIISNKKINQTLEQMAQALFKSWFVDFEPVKAKMAVLEAGGSQADATLAAMTAISGKDADALVVFEREHPEQYAELKATAELFPSAMQESELGDIPEGWKFQPFGELLSHTIGGDWGKDESDDKHKMPVRIIRGTDIPNIKSCQDSNVPFRYVEEKKLKTRSLNAGDIVIEVSGGSPTQPTGRSIYVTDEILKRLSLPVEPASFCRLFRPKSKELGMVLGLHLEKIYQDGKTWLYQNQSTGISNFQTKVFLENEMVAVAQSEILKLFYKATLPFVKLMHSSENIKLTQLRDTLLPKLLSGEITLPEAEQAVSEAENV